MGRPNRCSRRKSPFDAAIDKRWPEMKNFCPFCPNCVRFFNSLPLFDVWVFGKFWQFFWRFIASKFAKFDVKLKEYWVKNGQKMFSPLSIRVASAFYIFSKWKQTSCGILGEPKIGWKLFANFTSKLKLKRCLFGEFFEAKVNQLLFFELMAQHLLLRQSYWLSVWSAPSFKITRPLSEFWLSSF